MSEQLKKGSKLLWYEIDSILGRGGFGITYLATDTNLETQVAIKEYLPADIAERKVDSYVIPKTGTDGEMYRWGLTRFIDEARILAKFKHPNIVRVNSVFEDNNTAYMVMEYEHGNNLDLMLRTPQYHSEARLVSLFDAILAGLEQVHAHNIIHRDIKPANIYIREDGSPVLLDFGSARQHVAGKSQNMTRILTKGYAPYEQMDEEGGRQGPWTDIYAIGATLYYAISRELPADSLSRFTKVVREQADPLIPANQLENAGNYSSDFLFAINQALQFEPENRPQTVHDFRDLLTAGLRQSSTPPASPSPVAEDATVLATVAIPKQAPDTESAAETVYGGPDHAAEVSVTPASMPPSQPASAPRTSAEPVHTTSKTTLIAASAAVASAILAVAAVLLFNPKDSTPTPEEAGLSEAELQRIEQRVADRERAERDRQAAERDAEARQKAEAQRAAERDRLAAEARDAEQLAEEAEARDRLAKLEQDRIAAENKQRELDAANAEAERERLAKAKKLEEEQARLEELQRITQAENDRLADLQREEEEAARKAEADREAKLAAERDKAAREKAEQEQAKRDANADRKKPVRVARPNRSRTITAAERQRQVNESDMQSISRLFNEFKIQLSSCDTTSLRSSSNGQSQSLRFIKDLCEQYSAMDLSIANFQSNVGRGVASADVKIKKLTSRAGDTVLPGRHWDTVSIKTLRNQDGYWQRVQW